MKGSLRLRAAFRVFRKSSTLALLQLDTIAPRHQPAAMSCPRGHERGGRNFGFLMQQDKVMVS